MIAIAGDLGLDRRRIRRVLYERGAAAPRAGLTAAQIRRAAELYEAGSSLADVADRFGVTANTIRRLLVDCGVEMRPRVGGRVTGDCHDR